MYFLEFSRMSQHGYMRHTATPPLVLEIGQKLWHEAYNYTTYVCVMHVTVTVTIIRI